jgi:hypothetical protein
MATMFDFALPWVLGLPALLAYLGLAIWHRAGRIADADFSPSRMHDDRGTGDAAIVRIGGLFRRKLHGRQSLAAQRQAAMHLRELSG